MAREIEVLDDITFATEPLEDEAHLRPENLARRHMSLKDIERRKHEFDLWLALYDQESMDLDSLQPDQILALASKYQQELVHSDDLISMRMLIDSGKVDPESEYLCHGRISLEYPSVKSLNHPYLGFTRTNQYLSELKNIIRLEIGDTVHFLSMNGMGGDYFLDLGECALKWGLEMSPGVPDVIAAEKVLNEKMARIQHAATFLLLSFIAEELADIRVQLGRISELLDGETDQGKVLHLEANRKKINKRAARLEKLSDSISPPDVGSTSYHISSVAEDSMRTEKLPPVSGTYETVSDDDPEGTIRTSRVPILEESVLPARSQSISPRNLPSGEVESYLVHVSVGLVQSGNLTQHDFNYDDALFAQVLACIAAEINGVRTFDSKLPLEAIDVEGDEDLDEFLGTARRLAGSRSVLQWFNLHHLISDILDIQLHLETLILERNLADSIHPFIKDEWAPFFYFRDGEIHMQDDMITQYRSESLAREYTGDLENVRRRAVFRRYYKTIRVLEVLKNFLYKDADEYYARVDNRYELAKEFVDLDKQDPNALKEWVQRAKGFVTVSPKDWGGIGNQVRSRRGVVKTLLSTQEKIVVSDDVRGFAIKNVRDAESTSYSLRRMVGITPEWKLKYHGMDAVSKHRAVRALVSKNIPELQSFGGAPLQDQKRAIRGLIMTTCDTGTEFLQDKRSEIHQKLEALGIEVVTAVFTGDETLKVLTGVEGKIDEVLDVLRETAGEALRVVGIHRSEFTQEDAEALPSDRKPEEARLGAHLAFMASTEYHFERMKTGEEPNQVVMLVS